jgi:uncharacterized protein YkuJ
MKKIVISLIGFFLILWIIPFASAKDLEIKGRKLASQKPPFTLSLPSELQLVHSFSHENPEENSRTRIYLCMKEKDKQVEEMLIIQIADKTNPQAGPITVPPLKPYDEKKMYLKDRKKKGELEVDYLIQLMAWNPESPTLQPVRKKGIVIPSHWAMQGQFIFIYQGEHAAYVRYSKDTSAFELKVSDKGEHWEKRSISGNQKKVYQTFQKSFMEMVDSVQIKSP